MLRQGTQALNAVREVQPLRDRPLATMTRSGGISDKITFLSQWALKMLLEIVPVFISMKHRSTV